jgi:hypothetical protein
MSYNNNNNTTITDKKFYCKVNDINVNDNSWADDRGMKMEWRQTV